MKTYITPYDWSSYLVGLIISIFLLFSPNTLLGVILSIVIQILMLLECFKKAIINENQIIYKSILTTKNFFWSEIKSIQLKGGFKVRFYFVIVLRNGKKYKVFADEKNRLFVKELCKQKNINYQIITSINVEY